jgi:hypothetical protein
MLDGGKCFDVTPLLLDMASLHHSCTSKTPKSRYTQRIPPAYHLQ